MQNSQEKEISIQTVTSNKCPLGKCDGNGLIYVPEFDAYKVCECMKLDVQKKMLSFACIPEEFREFKVNEFDVSIYSSEENRIIAQAAKGAAVGLVKNFEKINDIGRGLYFYSAMTGSGKTRLMASLGNAIVKTKNVNVRFITASNLFDKIKGTFNGEDDEYGKMMDEIKNIDVLLLDDIGAEMPTDWTSSIFCSILNERLTQKKMTIFTSNYSINKLPYDNRIISRINKMAVPIPFPEESIRQVIAERENQDFIKMLMEG